MALHNGISHTYHSTFSIFERNMRHSIWFFLFFLCFTFPCKHAFISTHRLCPHDQMKALLEFKDMLSINEDASKHCTYPYPKTMSWDNNSGNNSDCCLWDGVTCDKETGHVIELDLRCSKLYGTISSNTSDGLFHLTHLRLLNLAYNNLIGDIPAISSTNTSSLQILDVAYNELLGHGGLPDSIGKLTSLKYLDLSYTGLAGELPDSFWKLTSLKYLDLSNTYLAGELPDSIGSMESLTTLWLKSCSLSGSIPKSIENLTELTRLDLSYNSLSGSIPKSIGNLTKLTQIFLSGNNLSGSIPKSIGNLTRLKYLDLSDNNFHSQVPITISNLKKFKFLSLSNNRLNVTLPPWLFTIPSLFYLDMSSNQLTGPIPDIQNESSLEYINLSNNSLQGSIPHSIVNLVNLTYLFLSSNKFNGTVEPLFFSKLEKLTLLDLSRNFLRGSYPVPSVSLATLLTSHNELTGDIPSSICNLINLIVLDVSYNDFGGEIPQCLANYNNLEVLDLQKNRFSGTIPPISTIWLKTLNLNDNHFEGPIPESLSHCFQLELLDLGKNKLNGSFPHWLETFPELQVIVLHSNKFQGHVGTSKTIGTDTRGTYPTLRIFDLSNNEFTGLLPARYIQIFTAMKNSKEIGKPTYMESRPSDKAYYQYSTTVVWNGVEVEFERILTTLVTIDLSANNFVGHIPEALQELNSLRMLNLSHNSLTGSIPPSLGNLSNLQILDLSFNILTGTIPFQLGSMAYLAKLNVSYNHLVGPIPQGRQFNTFENNSYIENSGLCGLPLSDLCGDYKKPQSPFQFFSRGFTWEIVLFGYGCGVPFGLILGFLMFFVGWPRWFLGIAGPQNGRSRSRRNHT